nr:unnamed protein product [Spirometra erinaceieuropaei]
MPIRRSIPPADQRRTSRSLVTTVPTRYSIRSTVQRSPQYPVHAAQRAPRVTALTWFSPPVEAVARGVAAEQSPATWNHSICHILSSSPSSSSSPSPSSSSFSSPPGPGVKPESSSPEAGVGAGGWHGQARSLAFHFTPLGPHSNDQVFDQQ